MQFRLKKLCVLKILFSYRKVSIWKQFFTGFDIKKSLAFGSTFFMSHPAKNHFPISTFPYLNTIWRTNSYFLNIFFKNYIIFYFQIQRSVCTKDSTIAKLPMNWEEPNPKLSKSALNLQLLMIIKPYQNLTYNQKLKFVNLEKTINFYVMPREFPDLE